MVPGGLGLRLALHRHPSASPPERAVTLLPSQGQEEGLRGRCSPEARWALLLRSTEGTRQAAPGVTEGVCHSEGHFHHLGGAANGRTPLPPPPLPHEAGGALEVAPPPPTAGS